MDQENEKAKHKHTPGPWKVEYDGAGYPMIAGSEATDWGTEARYHWVAKVLPVPTGLYRGGKCRDTGRVMETEANARLIAATPAMYEALTNAVTWLDNIRRSRACPDAILDAMPKGCKGMNSLRAALEKARQ